MTTTGEIYRDLIRFKPDGLSPNAWAVKAGVSRTVWADMRRHGNPSRRTLEKLLMAAGSSLAEFEALRVGPETRRTTGENTPSLGDARQAWGGAALPPLPLIGASLIGELQAPNSGVALVEIRSGEILDGMPRPASLANDHKAFAMTIVARSMLPRFRPGKRIAVSPTASVAIGDDVLVTFRARVNAPTNGSETVIAELVARGNDSVELRQFEPDRSFLIKSAEIEAIHKILGELI